MHSREASNYDFKMPHSFKRLDILLPQRAILNALVDQLPQFSGTLLDVGCGRMPYKQLLLAPPSRVTTYIGMDMDNGQYSSFGPFDLSWDGCSIPLDDNSVNCAIATEVFEQCPHPERVMREVVRILKPGGLFFFTVPFLWPIHDPPFDQYRFTPFALDRHLRNSGFIDIQLKTLGGWDASLAQMIALWVRRRSMKRFWRMVLAATVLPIVQLLAKLDRPPASLKQYQATVMITGLSGTAAKSQIP